MLITADGPFVVSSTPNFSLYKHSNDGNKDKMLRGLFFKSLNMKPIYEGHTNEHVTKSMSFVCDIKSF